MGQLFALLYALAWGFSNVYTRRGLQDSGLDIYTGQFITIFINVLTNLIVYGIYICYIPPGDFNLTGFWFYVLAGLFNCFVGRALSFASISYIGASRAGTYKVTAPVTTVLAGVFLLGEEISASAWYGIIIVLAGVILVTRETVEHGHQLHINCDKIEVKNDKEAEERIARKGIVIGLLAGLILGGGNVLRKAAVNCYPDVLLGVLIGSLAALIFCVAFQIKRRKGKELLPALRTCWGTSYMWAGLTASLGIYFLFFSLIFTPVSITNTIAASEALFTMFVSYLMLGKNEMLNAKTVIGAVVIFAGVSLLFRV